LPRLTRVFDDAFRLLSSTDTSVQDLYERWWSGVPEVGGLRRINTQMHSTIETRRIQRMHDFEIHTDGFRFFKLSPGEFINRNNRYSYVSRWRSWSSDHWNWLQSEVPPLFPGSGSAFRIYVPSLDQSPEVTANLIFDELEGLSKHFILKYRRQSGVFHDSIVIWIDAPFSMAQFDLINNLVSRNQPLVTPPPLACHVGNVGVTTSPTSGESVGWLYCETIWTLHRLHGNSSDFWQQFESRGLEKDTPWNIMAVEKVPRFEVSK
jgi:hypothetical protein